MIKELKKIIDFLLFGNIFISFCSVSLIYSSCSTFNIPFSLSYSALTFFATLFIYNTQRVYYAKRIDKNTRLTHRKAWIAQNLILLKLISIASLVGVTVSLFYIQQKIIYFLFVLFILSIFYFISSVKLRNIFILKTFVLSFVWVCSTVIIPLLIEFKDPLAFQSFIYIIAQFNFIVSICIAFDIRDIKSDEGETTLTIPIHWGLRKSKLLALTLLTCSIFIMLSQYFSSYLSIPVCIAHIASYFILSILIAFSNEKRSEYYFSIYIDGVMVLLAFLNFILSYL